MKSKTWKKLLIVPPVVAGVVVVALMARGRQAPQRTRIAERARAVHALRLEPRDVVPRAIGYGAAEPGRTWRAVAEVSGRVVAIEPRLAKGEIFPADTELLRIDETDYRLRIARLEADIQSTEAELAKLQVTRENTEASLEVARRGVELAQRELERMRPLLADGTVSASAFDTQEQAVLREEAEVVTLENALRSTAADEAVMEARLVADGAQLDEAQRDLERTVVVTPFPCRIAEVDVELAQFVSDGAVMVEADGVQTAEVEAQMAIERVRHLMRPEERQAALRSFDSGEIWRQFGLEATVRLRGSGFTYEWPARFARATGGLDPKTRTVGFVAAVDNPYAGDERGNEAGGRPPVVKGMFLEVEFRGRPLPERVVIPITAVHEGRVYLVGEEERLEIRPVEVEFVQFDEAVIGAGLEGGERLVLTDLVPAIPGMLLAAVPAPADRSAAR